MRSMTQCPPQIWHPADDGTMMDACHPIALPTGTPRVAAVLQAGPLRARIGDCIRGNKIGKV